jgi:hypothetical protein
MMKFRTKSWVKNSVENKCIQFSSGTDITEGSLQQDYGFNNTNKDFNCSVTKFASTIQDFSLKDAGGSLPGLKHPKLTTCIHPVYSQSSNTYTSPYAFMACIKTTLLLLYQQQRGIEVTKTHSKLCVFYSCVHCTTSHIANKVQYMQIKAMLFWVITPCVVVISLTFQNNLSVPSSRVKNPKRKVVTLPQWFSKEECGRW